VAEADRLKMASPRQMGAIFDVRGVGLVLIAIRGLEKQLTRCGQFYSRIGFVHEFRSLNPSEMRRPLSQGRAPAEAVVAPPPEYFRPNEFDIGAFATWAPFVGLRDGGNARGWGGGMDFTY
jgi:hypothetical protein